MGGMLLSSLHIGGLRPVTTLTEHDEEM